MLAPADNVPSVEQQLFNEEEEEDFASGCVLTTDPVRTVHAFLLSFGQFLLLVCCIYGKQRRETVLAKVRRKRHEHLVKQRLDVHSLVHSTAPIRHVQFASTANTSRCGLSVPDTVDAVCIWATGHVQFANGMRVG